jgi:hypothetical protein
MDHDRPGSPHMVPIEHVNRHEGGLYYVMPLADGVTDGRVQFLASRG